MPVRRAHLRILLINDYEELIGGGEAYVRDLGQLLQERGHATELLAGSADWSAARSLVERWFSTSFYRRTSEAIRRFRPDVVHLHNCSRNISPSPALAARRARVPVVMTVHDAHIVCPKTWMIYADGDPCPHGFGRKCLPSDCQTVRMGWTNTSYHALKFAKVWLHRTILKNCVDVFVCPTRWLAVGVQRSLPAANVRYLPNFPAPRPTPVGSWRQTRAGEELRLLFVGRLSREKGLDTLLEAISLLGEKQEDFLLDVAGDGPLRDNLQRQCRRLHIEDRVIFHGWLGLEELDALYAAATALVVPSLMMENGPLVVLDAMAHGLPASGERSWRARRVDQEQYQRRPLPGRRPKGPRGETHYSARRSTAPPRTRRGGLDRVSSVQCRNSRQRA